MKNYRALIGGIVALAGMIAAQFDLAITEGQAEQIVTAVVSLVGILMAVFNQPPKKTPPVSVVAFFLLLATLPFFGGCATLERVKQDHPVTYEAGKAFISFALNSAKESFLVNNPSYREGLEFILDGLVTMPPAAAAEVLRGTIPDPVAREEFAHELAKNIQPLDPEAPTSGGDYGPAWVFQVVTRL